VPDRFDQLLAATPPPQAPTPAVPDRFDQLLAAVPPPQLAQVRAPVELPVAKPAVVGEKDPNYRGKAFSGGPLMDVMDVLAAGQYASAGLLMGRGPAEAISKRTSYDDVLAAAGVPDSGTRRVLGTVADIVLDPAWFVTPSKVFRIMDKLLPLTKALETLKATEPIQKIGRQVVYGFGLPEDLKLARIGSDTLKGKFINTAVKYARSIEKEGPAFQDVVTNYVEAMPAAKPAALRAAAELGHDPKAVKFYADAAEEIHTGLGQLEVRHGIISKESYDALSGRYAKRLYLRYENPALFVERLKQIGTDDALRVAEEVATEAAKAKSTYASGRVWGIDPSLSMQRIKLTPEIEERLGKITPIGYRVARGVTQAATAVGNAQFLEATAKYASDVAKEGFIHIPDATRFGAVADKFLPENIGAFVMQQYREVGKTEQVIGKILPFWKMGKTILSPAAQFRNFYGNLLLNSFNGIPVFRLPDLMGRSAEALYKASKGMEMERPAVQLAKTLLDSASTFTRTELNDYLVRVMAAGKSMPSMVRAMATKPVDFAGRAFEMNEIFAKTMNGLHAMEGSPIAKAVGKLTEVPRGLPVELAAAHADKAIFNYSQVPNLVERLRSTGLVPFASFAYFAGRGTMEGIWRRPAAVTQISKIMSAIEAANPRAAEERKVAPEWMKQFGQTFTPIKTKDGQDLVADLSYIIPFGNFVTSLEEPNALNQIMALSPFTTLVEDLARNQSRFTGRPISRPTGGSKQMQKQAIRDYVDYVYKFAFPSLMPSIFPGFKPVEQLTTGGYGFRNIEQAIASGGKKSWKIAVLGDVFGLKLRPFDVPKEQQRRAREFKENVTAIRSQIKRVALDESLSWDDRNRIITQLSKDQARLTAGWLVQE
jgi:hypothetical protein